MTSPGVRRSRLAAAAFETMPSEAAVLDEAGTVVLVNQAWREFGRRNGAGSGTCVGSNYLQVCWRAAAGGDRTAATAHAALEAVLDGHSDLARLDYPCHSPTEQRWYQFRACPLPGQCRVLVLHDDVTDRLGELAALRHQATHDPLTGLANRALLTDRLAAALLARDRRDRPRTAVLVLDLNRFKHVNDTYGHPTGDTVLALLAGRLRALTRAGDTVARWGGDEFVVVLVDATERSTTRFHERLVRSLRRPLLPEHGGLTVTASVGVALSRPGQGPAELLEAADRAALAAKFAYRRCGPPT